MIDHYVALPSFRHCRGVTCSTGHKREILLEKGLFGHEHIYWKILAKQNQPTFSKDQNGIALAETTFNHLDEFLTPENHLSLAPLDQKIRLYEIAHVRAGDKGNNINFSTIPYFPPDVKRLKIVITPDWVKRVVSPLLKQSSCPNVDDIETRGKWVDEHVNVEVYEVRGCIYNNALVSTDPFRHEQQRRPPSGLFFWFFIGTAYSAKVSHNVLRIALVAIIDRQLPFEYTITSRSTDVMVMALPAQNINHSAFRSMFEREKLFGINFNDWFRSLKLVLRVEKKLSIIKQPIPPALAADSIDQAFELRFMFEKQAGVERFDLIQTFHACKQEEGKSVSSYVLKMKGYVKQLERLGYVLQQDISVGLILNGLTCDFADFVRNYNMHNMGKTIDELHALLIEYEKGLPKRLLHIKSWKFKVVESRNPIRNHKMLKGRVKDDAYHHCKEVGHWKRNCPVYLVELMKKEKQVGTASSSGHRGERKLKQGTVYLYVGNDVRAQVEAIGSFDLVLPNGLVICLDNYHYAPTIARVSKNNVLYFNVIPCDGIYEIDMLNLVPNVNSIYNVSNKRAKLNLDSTYLWHCRLAHISKKRIEKLQHDGILKSTDDDSFDQCGCEALVKPDTPEKLQQRSVKCIFVGYPKETIGYYFYLPLKNKIVIERYAEFLEKNLISQEVNGMTVKLKEIQDEDTSPFENTSEIPPRDLNEPANYKAALLDLESNKWLDYMNEEMQSMKDNQVWRLVIHPHYAKGYTQTYEIDYEETFSPVADIRAIRILIAIAAFYDYEIWQMDVKTVF
ncbi:retrotransposon protein, putative, ty1-copia subclass [Tanacetum coccineum]